MELIEVILKKELGISRLCFQVMSLMIDVAAT